MKSQSHEKHDTPEGGVLQQGVGIVGMMMTMAVMMMMDLCRHSADGGVMMIVMMMMMLAGVPGGLIGGRLPSSQ